MSLLTLYLMSSWVTTHVHSLGVTVAVAILIGTLFQVGGVFGTIFGWMVDRLGPGITIVAAYATAAISIACIGFAGSNLLALAIAVFAAGFGVIGGQSATNALAAISYPTQVRSTGVGWATGIGRIGSIIGPSLAGVLVGFTGSTQSIFFFASDSAALRLPRRRGVVVAQGGRRSPSKAMSRPDDQARRCSPRKTTND